MILIQSSSVYLVCRSESKQNHADRRRRCLLLAFLSVRCVGVQLLEEVTEGYSKFLVEQRSRLDPLYGFFSGCCCSEDEHDCSFCWNSLKRLVKLDIRLCFLVLFRAGLLAADEWRLPTPIKPLSKRGGSLQTATGAVYRGSSSSLLSHACSKASAAVIRTDGSVMIRPQMNCLAERETC